MRFLGYLLSNGFPWARNFLQMLLYYSFLGVQCILGDPSWKGEIKKSEQQGCEGMSCGGGAGNGG